MASERLQILLPAGRLIGGSTTVAFDKDFNGNPLKNADGTPKVQYVLEVAVPKTPGVQHWASESWGQQIWAKGHADFPGGQAQRPDFAWKIVDGDSQIPNLKGTKPCDKPNGPGHWLLTIKSGFAPKTVNRDGSAAIDPATIKLGNWVQVYITVAGNGNLQKPGIYLNHNLVALAGYDPAGEIQGGPDPSTVGFGQGGMPQHVSTVPVGGVSGAQAAAHTPPPPGAPVHTPPPPGGVPTPQLPPMPGAPAPAPVPVPPNPAMTAAALAPPAPAAPAARVMLPAANGTPYEAYKAQGWTDEQLVQHGLMAP